MFGKKITDRLPPGTWILTAVSIGYLASMIFLIGLKTEHWIVTLVFNLLFYAGKGSRKFILGFAIFALFGVLYDVMRAFPNYLYHTVDIAPLYELEKRLFGIETQGIRLTPNEFFAANHNAPADFLSGFFYINWMPVPLAFAVYLYFTNRRLFLHFSITFFFINLIGFCIYYIHPAAPPWYVSEYGSTLNLHTPGSAAGLSRFDQLVKMKIFGSIYSKNSNVFAAIPSLHCAYPVVLLYYGLRAKCGWINWLFGLFMAGIWFAAVYSGHHYIIDVILGVLCALTGITIYQLFLQNRRFYNTFFDRYLKEINN
ncbi:MAG: phosphatase PAP2 family protein [Bacteroidales bacterium]|nr:phosphatase PAP2 family protein [Bacteroidales bacterium]